MSAPFRPRNGIQSAIWLRASEQIVRALEMDEDAYATARQLREDIRLAWTAALERAGMPEDQIRKLAFPF